jgi:hypothetical protein
MKYMMFVCTDTEPETDEARIPDIHGWVAENDHPPDGLDRPDRAAAVRGPGRLSA